MTSCKLNLKSKTYFGQGLANLLKVWKCKNHFLDFRVSWREDCTGWLCDGRCELLSLVGNLRSHLTCLHTPHTTHYTCLHTLPCPTSGQPTAGTENWKSILYKSGDFSFQVFKNKQKHKMALWLKITYFCRSTKKSPKHVRRIPCCLQLPWWWRCKIIENKYKLWTDCITGIKVNIEDKIHIEYPNIQSYKYSYLIFNYPLYISFYFSIKLGQSLFWQIPFSPDLFKVFFKIPAHPLSSSSHWCRCG